MSTANFIVWQTKSILLSFHSFNSACASSDDATGLIHRIKLINNETWLHNGETNYGLILIEHTLQNLWDLIVTKYRKILRTSWISGHIEYKNRSCHPGLIFNISSENITKKNSG